DRRSRVSGKFQTLLGVLVNASRLNVLKLILSEDEDPFQRNSIFDDSEQLINWEFEKVGNDTKDSPNCEYPNIASYPRLRQYESGI
ncbi:hypothetical protein K0M31_011774, partial [Melipona bicolor]